MSYVVDYYTTDNVDLHAVIINVKSILIVNMPQTDISGVAIIKAICCKRYSPIIRTIALFI